MRFQVYTIGSFATLAIFLWPCFGLDMFEGRVHAADNNKEIARTYHVEGMTCGGCAVGVKLKLKKAKFNVGEVTYEEGAGKAVVKFPSSEYDSETDCKVIKTINDSKYTAYLDRANKFPCK